jgi:hypothetical protein
MARDTRALQVISGRRHFTAFSGLVMARDTPVFNIVFMVTGSTWAVLTGAGEMRSYNVPGNNDIFSNSLIPVFSASYETS